VATPQSSQLLEVLVLVLLVLLVLKVKPVLPDLKESKDLPVLREPLVSVELQGLLDLVVMLEYLTRDQPF
jgi:hypothetical protein